MAAAAAAGGAAKDQTLPRGWVVFLQVAATLVGVLLLVAGYLSWFDTPETEIGKTSVDGKEIVLTKKTTTTAADKAETVVEEPAVAVAGRSETVAVAFLALGTLLVVAAALPGRTISLKGLGFEGTIGAAATEAAQGAEDEAKKKGAKPAEVKAVGVAAAREVAVRLQPNLEREEPGVLRRALGTVSGGLVTVPNPADTASKAARETIEQAQQQALEQVLGPTQG